MALARAAGSPLYFLPFFLTAPRATRFCNFSYARKRSISSPPLAAFRARRFSCTISKSCLNSNDARRESTATNSSVTRSGTRRENAFFLRIAISQKSYHILPSSAADFSRGGIEAFLWDIYTGVPACHLLWRLLRSWRGRGRSGGARGDRGYCWRIRR